MNKGPFVFGLCLVCSACSPTVPALRPGPLDSARLDSGSDADPRADAEHADTSPVDAPDTRAPDFRLVLLDAPLAIERGRTSLLRLRIERIGGFDAPVLVDLWGLPDTVWAQARESRPGDLITEITVEASEDAAPVEDSPFAVQASALGIRRVERTTVSIH